MFIGITTAPRTPPTVHITVACVRECGYSPVLFAEPYSTKCMVVKTFLNKEKLGAWKNWFQAAAHGIESGEEHIVLLQDDIDIHPDTLRLASHIQYKGILSLYTSSFYSSPPGKLCLHTGHLYGACALFFKRQQLIDLLETKRVVSWEREAGIDILLGRAARDLKLPFTFLFPSPVAHIAETSSLGHGGNEGVRNCLKQADKRIPLEKQIWPN